MNTGIKIRAIEKNGTATVKCRMRHPMETGLRKDAKTGMTIAAHYITDVECRLNGNKILTAYFGPAVSKNPYLSFDIFDVSKGDMLTIAWVDNKGASESGEAEIG